MEELNFASRLWLALVLPFKILFDGRLAARVARQQTPRALPEAVGAADESEDTARPATEASSERAKTPSITSVEPEADVTPALQLLSILQREGRFVDFLQEELGGAADAEIGAAARVVQEGCKRGLAEYVTITPIRSEAEGAQITLESGYDAARTRVTGNVAGQPPYRGVLAHHGWRVESIRLPQLSANHDPRVLAPAEVEL